MVHGCFSILIILEFLIPLKYNMLWGCIVFYYLRYDALLKCNVLLKYKCYIGMWRHLTISSYLTYLTSTKDLVGKYKEAVPQNLGTARPKVNIVSTGGWGWGGPGQRRMENRLVWEWASLSRHVWVSSAWDLGLGQVQDAESGAAYGCTRFTFTQCWPAN